MQRFTIAIAGLTLALLWINAIWKGIWDWLLISGWFALITGLLLAHNVPDKLEHMLDRLANREALAVTPEQLHSFKQELETRVQKYWALGGASTVALAILVAFAFAFPGRQVYFKIPLILAEMLGGYIAGCYLGRMACYGTLGSWLKSAGIELRVIPGHPDSVGGLKPIGDLYFYQAMVVAIKTKRLFRLNNVALLLPLIAEYTGLSKQWAEFLKTMLGAG
jgi:hypothetical protein